MTTTLNLSEKNIASFEARRHFGELIDGVKSGEKFVITEHGKQVAAVVPLAIYETWKKDREEFFNMLHDMQDTANLSGYEAVELANKTVKAVRAENRHGEI